MSIFKNGFKLTKPAPAPTVADLEARLADLQASDPMAAVPKLKADRTAALLAGDYEAVNRFDAEIRKAELDSEKKELQVEQCHRELERAKADELEDARKTAKTRGDAATKRMPDALAAVEKAADAMRAALDEVDAINAEVEAANALLPEGERLPCPELEYRGALPAEPRVEVGRRRLGSRWFYIGGAPVDPAKFELVEGSERKAIGDIETRDGVHGRIEILDRALGGRRFVEVVKKDAFEVEYLEHRSAFNPVPLSAQVLLPQVMPEGGVDPRPPRERFTQIVHQYIAPAAKPDSEAA
jgi:hypothetical protein